jgi:hypothetical protein
VAEEIRIHPVDCAHDNMMDPIPAEKIGVVLANELGKAAGGQGKFKSEGENDDQSVRG